MRMLWWGGECEMYFNEIKMHSKYRNFDTVKFSAIPVTYNTAS